MNFEKAGFKGFESIGGQDVYLTAEDFKMSILLTA